MELLSAPEHRYLRNSLVTLAVLLSVFVVAKTIGELKSISFIGSGVTPQTTISVSGMGEVYAKPDIASFTFTVLENAATVADAQKKATDKSNKAVEALKAAGVAEKDIKTVAYNISPQYEYQPYICTQSYCPPTRNPKVIGYEVSQTFEIKVRDLEKAGALLQQVGSLEVSSVGGLNFSIEEMDTVQREARQEAIDKAQAKAKELAKDLGVRLVRIVSYNEGGFSPIYYAKDMAYGMGGATAESAPAPSVPTGENKITSNVTIVYEIQ